MDLKAYLKSRGMTANEFAKIAGLSKSGMSKYLSKNRLPDLLIAVKIEKITKGAVTIEDMIKYYKSGKGDE